MRAVLLRTVPALLLLSVLPRPVVAGVDRWTPLGPDGGDIWSLAADPDRPGTVYAGTLGGGVWKSSDGGGHWSPTPEGLGGGADVVSLGVSAGRVWAATTSGLFVLTEGAPTWRLASPEASVGRVAIDPTNPDRIWALDWFSGAVWLSEDGGSHWQRPLHLRFGFADLAVAATTPPTVYVAGSEGLFVSTDTGATWRQAPPLDANALALDPGDSETLYASTSDGVWKTTDQGRSGSYVTRDFRPRPLLALPGSLLGANPGLWRSEDDGATWMLVPQLANSIFRSLAADPFTPGGAWLGTEGQGVFRTRDGGRSWVVSQRGLGASRIKAFAFDPFRPRTLYTADLAGFQRSVDAGASWSLLRTRSRLDVFSLAPDPRHPGLLYAGTSQGILLSRDRGVHWQRSLKAPDSGVVAVDPLQPGVVYVAGTRFWRSRDGGRTWKRLSNPVVPGYGAVKIAFSPHHPGTLYLFDADGGIFYPRSLSRSTDGGNTWQRIVRSGASSLAFDIQTPGLLYLGTASGEIRKSRDGGTTWEHVSYVIRDDSNNSPLTALLSDPVDPSILYAGSAGGGVWRSTDHGVTWEPLARGLIAPTITCLEADPRNPRHLVACTQGGGLLEIQLSSAP